MNIAAEKTESQETRNNTADLRTGSTEDFLTITIADQIFGIPVLQVQDVLGRQKLTKIPLAPLEVAGVLNLRGRVVTAINVRQRLGLSPHTGDEEEMNVVVEHENELYSLIIDKVGDVLSLQNEDYESNPATLDPVWRETSTGIFRLEEQLLLVLDVQKLLNGWSS